ncbi:MULTISPECIES: hypothetical protein [unclassified Deinococcus]|uniref:hypothetical protein n=1 Tax=unclassified Deinococcus TaxID=2623546 RepID=UPI001C2FC49B|nr:MULTISPECIES: hypothetical protein [unclassified Deinococcus]MDK2011869.1 hypothetical protein [Deinococcus sp. 43]
MPYPCALTIDDELALNAPLIFEERTDAQTLVVQLRKHYDLTVTMTKCERSTIAQPFNLRAFSWWLNTRRPHVYADLEHYYRRNLMVVVRTLPDHYLTPFTPPPPRREPQWVPDTAPPLVNHYWQDQQLDRADFHAHLALGDPPPREYADTWWFHSQLDREDFEEYLAQDGQEQVRRDNPPIWEEDDVPMQAASRENADDVKEQREEPYYEEVYTSDLFEIYAEAHDFDEWN